MQVFQISIDNYLSFEPDCTKKYTFFSNAKLLSKMFREVEHFEQAEHYEQIWKDLKLAIR